MRRHLQKVAGGGIAWERQVFTSAKLLSPTDLLDAAVDIACERLLPSTLERPDLDIRRHGNLIVFRIENLSVHQLLRSPSLGSDFGAGQAPQKGGVFSNT